MKTSYDVIVIGAGHNGLTCATLLANKGLSTLVLERMPRAGGLAGSREFHPSYWSGGLLHNTSRISRDAVSALGLDKHGVTVRPHREQILVSGETESLLIGGEPGPTGYHIAQTHPTDGRQYLKYQELLAKLRPVVLRFAHSQPIDLLDVEHNISSDLAGRAIGLRMLGKHTLTELLRSAPMAVSDFLNEWFENQTLKVGMAIDALMGVAAGPRSPETTANLLLNECRVSGSVIGGTPTLVEGLLRASRSAGVEVRYDTPVAELLIENGEIAGVRLADGNVVRSRVVASSADPRTTLLNLAPRGSLSLKTEERVKNFRARGTIAQALFAVSGPVQFKKQKPGHRIQHARIVSTINGLEKAFDATKYRRPSAQPALDVFVPTIERPDLAPAGHTVLSVLAFYAPYEVDGGWTDATRSALLTSVQSTLEAHIEDLPNRIVAREVLSPADIERIYGTSGGHIFHGEPAIDQVLVRPIPECFDYATPIEGLFLCGSGTHSGGGLTCSPGWLSAQRIVKVARKRRAA